MLTYYNILFNPFKDPESAEMELKISNDIEKMPEEVKIVSKPLKF